jgi:hypothetical protein
VLDAVQFSATDGGHGAFTATHLSMGSFNATAYIGAGEHFDVGAHRVVSLTIRDGLYGPALRIVTATGERLNINLYGVRDYVADTTAPIVVTDEREGVVA